MEALFLELLKISAMCSVGIFLIIVVSPLLQKNHTVFWRYCLWVILAVRLILPFDFTLPGQAVVISLDRVSEEKKSDPSENILPAQNTAGKAGGYGVGKGEKENGEAGGDIVRQDVDGNENHINAVRRSDQNLRKNELQKIVAQKHKTSLPDRMIQWAALVWAVGALVLLFRQAACCAIFFHSVERTKVLHGQKGSLPVYISSIVSTPMLIGIRKPKIILPDVEYAKEELAFILEHELIHYKRKDLWIKLLLAFAKTLHWFNPLIFWMERQAVRDMELLCDGRVVRYFSREQKRQYGTALLNCASSKKDRTAVLCTSEFSRDVRTLKERFANIFSGGGKKRGVFVVVVGVLLVLSASLFVMFGASENGSRRTIRESDGSVSEEMRTENDKNGGKAEETGKGDASSEEAGGKDQRDSAQELQNGPQSERQPGDDNLFSRLITYTWQEITVSIPDAWEGKYYVRESEDGFSLVQKSSYEKHEGMTVDDAGATPLAFTDTQTYYMMEPTDVNYDYEDQEIANEYHEMYDLVKAVSSTLTINKEEVKYNPDEYILPLSDTIPVEADVLLNYSDNELKIARNEIYARHGRQFKDFYLAAYFNSCSWYEGTVPPEEFGEGALSQTEKENLRIIRKAEEAYKADHPYPREYQAGEGASEDLDQDGRAETIVCTFEETDTWIKINGKTYALSDFDVQLVTPNTEVFYVTDIMPYQEGLEIALLDYGPSDDPETHFFSYEDGLHYLGSVSGFPFAQQAGRNGFTIGGVVIGESRMDFTHTSYIYDSWRYDVEGRKLVHEDGGYYSIVPERAHSLSEDITVYQEMDETHMKNVLPAQDQVFFLETDGKEWVLVKGKDGTKGYMHIVDGKITGISKEPGEVFSGMDFVG